MGRGFCGYLLCPPPALRAEVPPSPPPWVCVPPHSPVKFSPFEAFKPGAAGEPMELGASLPPPPEGTAPLPIKTSVGAKKQKGGRGRVPR